MRLSEKEVANRANEYKRQRNRAVRDLTGMKFNSLTVISRADDYINPSGNRLTQWNCQCDCGKMVVKRGTALTSGKAKSCGCARSKSNKGLGLIDLVGQQVGSWTVLERSEDRIDSRGKHWPMWTCRCECGTIQDVDGAYLRKGISVSCGCKKASKSVDVSKPKKKKLPKVPIPERLQKELVHDDDKCLSANSHEKVEWRCEQGHIWFASVASRTRSGSGCPYCSRRKPVVGVNDLATLRPDIAATLVDPSEAFDVGIGSSKKLMWRCTENPEHVWKAEVRARCGIGRTSATGCPYCANRGVRKEHRLPEAISVDETLLVEAVNPSDLDGLTAGSGQKILWKCSRGAIPHTYWMAIRRKVAGQGCPVCAGKIVVSGINDLTTVCPDLASELVDEADGDTVTRGSERELEWQCEKGHRWKATVYSRVQGNGCPVCSHSGTSRAEDDLYNVIVGLIGEDNVVRHDQTILPGRYELDVVVPSKYVAVEFNGLYWHSVDAGKDPEYHKRKHDLVKNAGYQLIQIWEDDWQFHRAACEKMLAAKLGVAMGERLYARNLVCESISGVEAGVFMDANHIQGHCNAQWHWGLRKGDTLVAVISVRKTRQKGVYEICRYATSDIVVAGFSKLLKEAESSLLAAREPLQSWISFSANDISNGNMYKVCGFEIEAELDPEYQYVGRFTKMRRTSKRSFQRKRFRDDPNLLWDEEWTEREAAQKNGLFRVYDSGKLKWRKSV